MANPDRPEGRWQRAKDKLAVSAFIAIAPLVIKSSLAKTDIESGDTRSTNPSEMEFFRQGRRVGFLKQKGYFKTFVGDGGTMAGTIADHPVVVWDIPEGRTHNGRARVKIDGKIVERLREDGKTVFSMHGGRTFYVEDGQRKKLGKTGIAVTYSRRRR